MDARIALIHRPMGFLQDVIYEQECVRIPGNRFATLLDIQAGKALVLLFEEFRTLGHNGLLELPLDEVEKQYEGISD